MQHIHRSHETLTQEIKRKANQEAQVKVGASEKEIRGKNIRKKAQCRKIW